MKKQLQLVTLITAFACTTFNAIAQTIQEELRTNSSTYQVSQALIETLTETNRHISKHNNIEYIYLKSQIDGIDVENQILTVIKKDGKILKINYPEQQINFKKIEDRKTSLKSKSIPSTQAIKIALKNLGFSSAFLIEKGSSKEDNLFTYKKTKNTSEEITAEKVFLINDNGELVLAWKVFTYTEDRNHAFDSYINASTGAIIQVEDNVIHCSFGEPSDKDHTHRISRKNIKFNQAKNLLTSDATYNVFDLYVESPIHGNRTLVSAPWLRAGTLNDLSDNGWHSNGISTYTTTKGNNVDAFADWDDSNLPTDGNLDRAQSDTYNFDFPFNDRIAQDLNKDAAVTNLFFWNNITHDVLYKYGFDEAAGNFQSKNFGNGGIDGDFVVANAQDGFSLNDGSHINNANFYSPVDGSLPRMQMYKWSNSGSATITLNTSNSLQIDYVEGNLSANNKLDDVGAVTADIVLVQDTTGGTNEGCTTNPISNLNELSEKIAVIRRGSCAFTEKILNAQNAGAVAVIVINNQAGSPGIMGGTDDAITIPSVMISRSDGDTLLRNSPATENITISPTEINFYPDGDFDNGIIAHEYAHGLSIRLTGGANTTSCLRNQEQMGEGWSDFVALMLVTDWSNASGTDARAIGTYPSGQPTDGIGIRQYPYSTDFTINPQTYDDIKTLAIPHGVGSLWTTMLWDLVWEIEKTEGIDNDIYSRNGANGIVFQLVTDGLKNQVCSPGFVDGRDAILLADELNYDGKYKCAIWEAFARRGLGFSAVQGSSNSISDGVEAFDLPPGVSIEITANKREARANEEIVYTIVVEASCESVNNVSISNELPLELIYLSGGNYDGTTVSFTPFSLSGGEIKTLTYTTRVKSDVEVNGSSTLYDFEDGLQGWEPSSITGNVMWQVSSINPFEGDKSLYGPVESERSNITVVSPEFLLTPTTEISFMHAEDMDIGSAGGAYEGGLVQITTDGGTSWNVLDEQFSLNGYNTFGSSITDYYEFDAFSGKEIPYSKSIISFENLPAARLDDSAYGSNAQIRFVTFSDSYGYGSQIGWVVDNVQIGSASVINNSASVSYGNNEISTSNTVVRLSALIFPVELGEFTAKTDNNNSVLNWNTLSENNNKHFNVQRSLNGEDFTTIATKEGAGTTQMAQNYVYNDLDAAFLASKIYYRLEQVDFDGTVTFTSIETVEFDSKEGFTIYPNPANQKSIVMLQGNNIEQVAIYSQNGQLLQSEQYLKTNNIHLDISTLNSGFYFILINNEIKQKLVIN